MAKIIIRRCAGNKRAWLAETESGFSLGTDMDLGCLVERTWDARHAADELVLSLDWESEAEARHQAMNEEVGRLHREIARATHDQAARRRRLKEITAPLRSVPLSRPGDAAAIEAERTGEDYMTVAARMNLD